MKFIDSYKYLGVTIDARTAYIEHVRKVRDKLIKYVITLRRYARKEWGLNKSIQQILQILYRSICLPIFQYGAIIWYDKAVHVCVRRHILAAQRVMLLAVLWACRTVSTAMQVITGLYWGDASCFCHWISKLSELVLCEI